MKMFLLPVIATLALLITAANAEEQRDGNLWLKFTRQDKMVYLSGVFDGMQVGGDAASGICGHRSEIMVLMNKMMSPITTPQVADGLDAFYKDYRNRSITIPDAFDLVVGLIRGADPAEIESRTRRLRKDRQ